MYNLKTLIGEITSTEDHLASLNRYSNDHLFRQYDIFSSEDFEFFNPEGFVFSTSELLQSSADIPGDMSTTAVLPIDGTVIAGEFETFADSDWYRVTIDNLDDAFRLSLTEGSVIRDNDIEFSIYNAMGERLYGQVFTFDSDTLVRPMTFKFPEVGDYFVGIVGYRIEPYEMVANYEYDHPDTMETALSIDLALDSIKARSQSQTQSGGVELDWFQFEITVSDTTVDFDFDHTNSGFWGITAEIYDASGQRIYRFLPSDRGALFQRDFEDAGTYFLVMLDNEGFSNNADTQPFFLDTRLVIQGIDGENTLQGSRLNESLYGANQNDVLIGRAGDDYLYGYGGNDLLIGNIGDDTLLGSDGNDRMRGDDGADQFIGGNGIDTAFYANAAAAIALNLETGGTIGDADGDSFSSIERVIGSEFSDVITGDAFANTLVGRAGDDYLDGGAGSDVLLGKDDQDILNGGLGDDRLLGGMDSDIFVFETDNGIDRILDFTEGVDLIDVSALYTDFAAFEADTNIYSLGTNWTVIELSVGNEIWLRGTVELDAADFVF